MTEDLTEARDRIHRQASAHAEASVYSLNNTYLSQWQKAQVEAVWQFPIGVFAYPFVVTAVALDQSFWVAYGVATVFSAMAWLIASRAPAKPLVAVSFLYAGWIGMLIHIALAVWALVEGRLAVAIFTGLDAIGLASFLTIGMWLWSATSRRMNPKYAIAKRLFGIEFPFEKDLAR
jgi:hypothetical protein